MELRKILVATDFSEEGTLAVEHAAVIAKLRDAQLTIAHVFEAGASAAAAFAHGGGAERLVVRLLEHEAKVRREKLGAIEIELTRDQIDARSELLEGHADEAIRSAAKREDIDLVVVGTRGRTGLKKVLLGSVATTIARSCCTPVYISRGPAPSRFAEIVVAVDLEGGDEDLVEAALALAAPTASVELLHVYTPPLTDLRGDADAIPDEIEARGQELVRSIVEQRPGIQARFSVVRDMAGHGIMQRLEQGCDLAVVGRAHGHKLRHFLLGSVAERVARHAHCPVLIAQMGPD
jgi:nucleotide-binding universal stress UspA family protein